MGTLKKLACFIQYLQITVKFLKIPLSVVLQVSSLSTSTEANQYRGYLYCCPKTRHLAESCMYYFEDWCCYVGVIIPSLWRFS